MSKDSDQTLAVPRKFKLGHLGSLNQVIKALGVTIRAMADGTLDYQGGARICNGLGILRACLEAQQLEKNRMAAVSPENGGIRKIIHEFVHLEPRPWPLKEIEHQDLLVERKDTKANGNGKDGAN
jgi:hypothetical protein